MEVDGLQSDEPIPLPYGIASTSIVTTEEWHLIPKIDDSNTSLLEKSMMDRFITVLDQIDTRVENLRKEALKLQEKRDTLLMSMDLMKNNDFLGALEENEREEIHCYMHRVGSRLATVDLSVITVRNNSQEECLHQVNVLIDSVIKNPDPLMSRQKCQTFINACGGVDHSQQQQQQEQNLESPLTADKIFESALLGCTLDDQKTIKRRLFALMTYLNKQTVTD